VIGRARWNTTTLIHRPQLRSTRQHYHYEPERIQTEWRNQSALQYGLNTSQRRYRSDLLKYRAVEALKKKNSTSTGASVKNDATDKNEVATSTQKNAAETTAADNRQLDFYGDDYDDDHQLAGLTAASTPSPSSSSVGSAAKVESTYESSAASSLSSQATNLSTNSANSINDTEIREATKINTDSNPWAHMQLHEFAPKIVVVGVGGAVSLRGFALLRFIVHHNLLESLLPTLRILHCLYRERML